MPLLKKYTSINNTTQHSNSKMTTRSILKGLELIAKQHNNFVPTIKHDTLTIGFANNKFQWVSAKCSKSSTVHLMFWLDERVIEMSEEWSDGNIEVDVEEALGCAFAHDDNEPYWTRCCKSLSENEFREFLTSAESLSFNDWGKDFACPPQTQVPPEYKDGFYNPMKLQPEVEQKLLHIASSGFDNTIGETSVYNNYIYARPADLNRCFAICCSTYATAVDNGIKFWFELEVNDKAKFVEIMKMLKNIHKTLGSKFTIDYEKQTLSYTVTDLDKVEDEYKEFMTNATMYF